MRDRPSLRLGEQGSGGFGREHPDGGTAKSSWIPGHDEITAGKLRSGCGNGILEIRQGQMERFRDNGSIHRGHAECPENRFCCAPGCGDTRERHIGGLAGNVSIILSACRWLHVAIGLPLDRNRPEGSCARGSSAKAGADPQCPKDRPRELILFLTCRPRAFAEVAESHGALH